MARYNVRGVHTTGKHGSAGVEHPDPLNPDNPSAHVSAQRALANRHPGTNSDGWTITHWIPETNGGTPA